MARGKKGKIKMEKSREIYDKRKAKSAPVKKKIKWKDPFNKPNPAYQGHTKKPNARKEYTRNKIIKRAHKDVRYSFGDM